MDHQNKNDNDNDDENINIDNIDNNNNDNDLDNSKPSFHDPLENINIIMNFDDSLPILQTKTKLEIEIAEESSAIMKIASPQTVAANTASGKACACGSRRGGRGLGGCTNLRNNRGTGCECIARGAQCTQQCACGSVDENCCRH